MTMERPAWTDVFWDEIYRGFQSWGSEREKRSTRTNCFITVQFEFSSFPLNRKWGGRVNEWSMVKQDKKRRVKLAKQRKLMWNLQKVLPTRRRYVMKRREPGSKPWGTPELTGKEWDLKDLCWSIIKYLKWAVFYKNNSLELYIM